MNKIGFRNFRRFKDFPALEYGGITFLVGRNNAGKSTLVKALLLLDHYFKSGDIHQLSFSNSVLEDANIVTYGRALNNDAKAADENFIYFEQQIEDYVVLLTISGQEEQSFAAVHQLVIVDTKNRIEFHFDMVNSHVTITKGNVVEASSAFEQLIGATEQQIAEVNSQLGALHANKTSKEYIDLLTKREGLERKLEELQKDSTGNQQEQQLFSIDEHFGNAHSLIEIVDGLLVRAMGQYEREFTAVQQGQEPSEQFEDLRALKEFDPIFIESSFSHFMTLANDFSIAYMGANPAKQSALFAIRDSSNALSQAIHDYKQLNIRPTDEEHLFVMDWMKAFEVGDNFSIAMHAGEAYEVKVHSGNHWVYLADKGMGSIQAMLLIVRLACVIRRVKNTKAASTLIRMENGEVMRHDSSQYRLVDKTTVIIEEPELNLHPGLQSKLADLFFAVHDTFAIDFLVETHSEYAIRKSQVIVAEQDLEVAPNENPFRVYYFPNDFGAIPYSLNYRPDGALDKNFGEGFFDEASKRTLELLRLKRPKAIISFACQLLQYFLSHSL